MKRIIALFSIALGACTAGVGQADVTVQNTVTFGGISSDGGISIPSGFSIPGLDAAFLENLTIPSYDGGIPGDAAIPTGPFTTDGEVSFNVRDDLEKMGKIGSLSVSILKNELSGTGLLQMQHIKATIATDDGTIPQATLTEVDIPANSVSIELPLAITDKKLIDYLEEGKVTVHFYVTGTPTTQEIMLTHTLAAHVDMAIQQSASNISSSL